MRLNSDLRCIHISGDFSGLLFYSDKVEYKTSRLYPECKKKNKKYDLIVTCFCSLSACFVFILEQTPKSAEIQIGSCSNNSRELQE